MRVSLLKNTLAGILTLSALVIPLTVEGAQKPKFRDLLNSSDAVVEGVVIDAETVSSHKVPVHVDLADESFLMEVGSVISVSFKVDRVLGGDLDPGATIEIYVYPELPQEKSELMEDKRYVLILRKHKVKDAYHVAGWGRASWLIFEREDNTLVKSWEQPFAVRNENEYLDYDELLEGLRQEMQGIKKYRENGTQR